MKKCPSSDWLAYPVLRKEDIGQESFRHSKFLSEALVDNRKGRVNLLFEHERYMAFLHAVKKKYGDASSVSVDRAAREAIEEWIAGVD